MQGYETNIRRVIEAVMTRPPEEMLEECLGLLIEISGATGGSILGEEGTSLRFLFADLKSLIGASVPWDSIAGATVRSGNIIYTYAPTDKRHYEGIDSEIKHETRYLLSLPIPAVHQSSDADREASSAGALQLLFDGDLFPEFDVSQGAKEFPLEVIREQGAYSDRLQEVFWILPTLSFGMEVMKLRQTSYQAIHELKNKMIGARSWLNCLREDLEEFFPDALANEDLDEDFHLVEATIREGANLAKSYLQFTKLYTPSFEASSINDILRQTAAAVHAFAEAQESSDVEVRVDLDDTIRQQSLDPNQIKMALFNLAKNAAEVLIEFGTPAPCVALRSERHGDGCCISVADNGPGMPADIAEHLFVAFKTKKEGGTGLGLTITKKIIEIHGGTIACQTGSGGTSFEIVL